MGGDEDGSGDGAAVGVAFPLIARRRDEWGTTTGMGCVSRLAFEVFPEAIGEFGAEFIGHAPCGALYFFDELVEVAA